MGGEGIETKFNRMDHMILSVVYHLSMVTNILTSAAESTSFGNLVANVTYRAFGRLFNMRELANVGRLTGATLSFQTLLSLVMFIWRRYHSHRTGNERKHTGGHGILRGLNALRSPDTLALIHAQWDTIVSELLGILAEVLVIVNAFVATVTLFKTVTDIALLKSDDPRALLNGMLAAVTAAALIGTSLVNLLHTIRHFYEAMRNKQGGDNLFRGLFCCF